MSELSIVVPLEKECTSCHAVKPLDLFYKEKRRLNGRGAQCKICIADKNRRYFVASSDEYKEGRRLKYASGTYARNANYKKKYGLTLEDVRKMHADQMGLCANRACGTEINVDLPKVHKNKAVVDHCHTTGKVRGLLCFKCNTSLGLLEDKNVVLGLTEYLQKYDQKFAFSKD